jgi:hypothetical protein
LSHVIGDSQLFEKPHEDELHAEMNAGPIPALAAANLR